MERKEVEELLSKIGISSDSDKESFRNMYNYVFDPLVKMSSFEQEGNRKTPNEPETTTGIEPEIQAFLAVLRRHFRSPISSNLTTVWGQAEAAFGNAVARQAARRSSQMTTADELKTFEAKLQSQIQTLKEWIREVDNYKFQKAVREDAVENFKLELSEKYYFDSMKFYEEADIRRGLKELEIKIVDEFVKEINGKFERNPGELSEWCAHLRKRGSQLGADAIQKNRQNQESWNQITGTAAAKFKETMEPFLKKHQFAKKEARDTFRDKAKVQCEEKQGLSQFLTDPVLKSAWDAKVEAEYESLRKTWQAEGDGRIKSFLETLKAEGKKAFKAEFGFELKVVEGSVELEGLYAQVANIARLNLEEANETTSDKKDNMANSSKTSLGSIGVTLQDGYEVIIPANTKLPTKLFRNEAVTVKDNQTSGSAGIYEGDSPHAVTSRKLGKITWTDIPAAKQGVETLDYTMKIDDLGLLHLEWEVRGSGRKETAQFETSAWKGNEPVKTKG